MLKCADNQRFFMALLAALLFACAANVSRTLAAEQPTVCCIRVVEKESGWPVPLVELRTNHHVRFITDNSGVIAFDLPELMGRETWFNIIADGYEVPADKMGFRGLRLTPEPGKTLTLEVFRISIA